MRLNIAAFNLGQLISGGLLARAVVARDLAAAGHAAGLPLAEVQRTINSGIDAGIQKPRSAPDPAPPATQRAAFTTQAQPATHTLPGPPAQPAPPARMPAAGPHIPAIPSYTLAELLASHAPPPEELIENRILLRDTLSLLVGASGSAKTMHVINLINALATGGTWIKWAVRRPCRVLWFSAEGGRALLKDRISRVDMNRAAAIPDAVRIVTFEEAGGVPPRITEPGVLEMIIRMALDHRADVVIFDPLVTFCIGIEEKSGAEMGDLVSAFLRLRAETKAAVMVVHHTRKPPQVRAGYDPLDPSESRGHGSFVDLSDAVLATYRKDDDYWLGFGKRRWGPYIPSAKLALDEATLRFSYVCDDEPNSGKKSGQTAAQLREFFEPHLSCVAYKSVAEIVESVASKHTNKRGKAPPSQPTISRHLRAAESAGIVVSMSEGRKSLWRLV